MRHRISPATVIASVALFFSLGGVGMAATGYRITSIFQIAPKVRAGLRGSQGPQGPQGPQGTIGPQGAAGPQGQTGTVDWAHTYVASAQTDDLTTANPVQTAIARCNAGDHVINGGYTGDNEIAIVNEPAGSGNPGWLVIAELVPGGTLGHISAQVTCAQG